MKRYELLKSGTGAIQGIALGESALVGADADEDDSDADADENDESDEETI